jgi:hypothetical protein
MRMLRVPPTASQQQQQTKLHPSCAGRAYLPQRSITPTFPLGSDFQQQHQDVTGKPLAVAIATPARAGVSHSGVAGAGLEQK